MIVEAARQSLFGDALACDGSWPASIACGSPDEAHRRGALQRAEAVLRALALLEESRGDERDESPADHAVRRLEAKVDLLVSLVGSLLHRGQAFDPCREVRWSARGATIELPVVDGACVPGAAATLRIQPSDALPEPIELPATVLAIEPSPAGRRVWLAFDSLPPSLEALLERHVFRMHRRAIAESRRQRQPM